MAEKRIEYTIKPDGSYTIKTIGYEGNACAEVTQKLIQKIGGSIEEEKKTDDWYKSPKSTISNGVSF